MAINSFVKYAATPVIGLIMMAFPIYWTYSATTKPDILETIAPGTAEFTVQDPGTYKVWRKLIGTYNHEEFRVEEEELPAGLVISIQRADNGTTVPIETSLGGSETINNQTKVSLISAKLEPGTYRLITVAPEKEMGLIITESRASFGGFFKGLALLVVGGLLVAGGCLVACIPSINSLIKKPVPPPEP